MKSLGFPVSLHTCSRFGVRDLIRKYKTLREIIFSFVWIIKWMEIDERVKRPNHLLQKWRNLVRNDLKQKLIDCVLSIMSRLPIKIQR